MRSVAARVFERDDNPHGPGRCWHCGQRLRREHRRQGLAGAWHVDHWPVRQSDIHHQWLWGVRDVHDESNLVPACAPCNTSHRWERRAWYWGGASQCPCRASWAAAAAAGLLLLLAAAARLGA